MLESLKAEVCAANRALPGSGLVRLTWGNVSGIDRTSGLWVIKPSGVDYEDLTPESLEKILYDFASVKTPTPGSAIGRQGFAPVGGPLALTDP